MEMDQKLNALRAQLDCIQIFKALPDEALVDLKTVSTLASRSRSSIYRDIRHGHLEEPLRLGKTSSRWRVEDVRAYLNGNSK
jgi:predicted DNA-binding transcriptional regulator AlpA